MVANRRHRSDLLVYRRTPEALICALAAAGVSKLTGALSAR